LLRNVRVEGRDGTASEMLPALSFDYTRFQPEIRTFVPVRGELPTLSLGHPTFEHADLFGRGLPDVVQLDGLVARYWRNKGNATYDVPRDLPSAPAGLSLADPAVQLLDADGDGRIDLMVTSERMSGYFPATFGVGWDRRGFRRYEQAPSFDLKDPE